MTSASIAGQSCSSDTSQRSLDIKPLSGSVGAAVTGVNLAHLADGEFETIRTAFLEHCVLVFPGQFLSTEHHVDFASRWGEFEINAMSPYLDEFPMVLPLTNRGKERTVTETWHYDSLFEAAPPAITILSARMIPVGGDTMWSSQYQAYDALSQGMKEMLDGRRALFSGHVLAELYGFAEVPSSFHPVVRTHPETGRKALFIGQPGVTVTHFEHMTTEESLPLLQFLYEQSTSPDRVYRHHWTEGDVVMWDNRCTMHYAVHDHGDAGRELHRITVKGDVPR